MKSISQERTRCAAAAVLVIGLLAGGVLRAAEPPDSTSLDREREYGVSLALRGDYALAESVFVSVLSRSPSGASALNNLGNLHLLRGHIEEALALYSLAASADTADGGVHLNRAIALLAAGRADEAYVESERGKYLAGGESAAAALLGLRPEGAEPGERGADVATRAPARAPADKSSQKVYVNRREVRALLKGAAAKVPDLVSPDKPPQQRVVSRAAGTRAAEDTELEAVLYWKR